MGEGTGVLRALPHHVDDAELFAHLREEAIAEGLKTKENMSCAHHQLRRSDPEVTQDAVDEGSEGKLHP